MRLKNILYIIIFIIMKNTTKILAATVATAIIATGISSTYAMGNGQGNWQGGGMWKNLTTEQRTEIQNMSESERQAYMQTLKNNSSTTVEINWKAQGKWNWQGQWQHKGQWKSWSWSIAKHSGNPEDMINKYESLLSKMSDEKLNQIDDKIDIAIQKVEEKTSISDTMKQKTIALYQALKEYIAELLK